MMQAWHGLVRITVRLATADRDLQRTLEPWAAPPRARLRQLAALRRLRFRVAASLEPLVPGLTDTTASLVGLLRAVADAGLSQLSAGYLYLRDRTADALRRGLPRSLADAVLGAYQNGPIMNVPGQGAAQFLPRGRRQRGYATLMVIAADHDLTVRVSAQANPDFSAARPRETEPRPRLLSMFLDPRGRHDSIARFQA
jgi:hypothetical protein